MSEAVYHAIETREELERCRGGRSPSQHRVGIFVVKPKSLRDAFPRFIRVKGDRVTRFWYFVGPDGELMSLYDYKETSNYEDGAPSEDDFWNSEKEASLSIGAPFRDTEGNEAKVMLFIEHLAERIPGSRGLTESAFARQYAEWYENQDNPEKEREMRLFVKRWCVR